MTLNEYIESLPFEKQFDLALKLCKLTIPIWRKEFKGDYVQAFDGCFLTTVRADLTENTIKEIELHIATHGYATPVTIPKIFESLRTDIGCISISIRDMELEVSREVELALYCVLNLAEALTAKNKVAYGGELLTYISANQAVDALMTSGILPHEQIIKEIYE